MTRDRFLDQADIRRAVQSIQQKGEHVLQSAKQALKEGADLIVADAKSRVPVKTGKLRDSIHADEKEDGAAFEITADARNEKGVPYARIVEYSPKINRPFLKPAIDAQQQGINQRIAAAMRQSS